MLLEVIGSTLVWTISPFRCWAVSSVAAEWGGATLGVPSVGYSHAWVH